MFAAQNPLREGGGRKGLPRSFLNRFTRVAVESMGIADLEAVRFLFCSASAHACDCPRACSETRALLSGWHCAKLRAQEPPAQPRTVVVAAARGNTRAGLLGPLQAAHSSPSSTPRT